MPHRQMLPSSASRACSAVGFGLCCRSPTADITNPGRAEAAHRAVVLQNCLLYRMEHRAVTQSFDGANILALRFDGQHRAGVGRLAIDNGRACSTRAAVAHALEARDVEAVAKRVEQCDARFDLERTFRAVDGQCD